MSKGGGGGGAAKPQAQAATPSTPEGFGGQANAIAASAPESVRFGDQKVFLSHVYERMRAVDPQLTRTEFERQIWAAHQRGVVTLSRADLVNLMDPGLVSASEIQVEGRADGPTVHFIRIKGR